MYYVYVLRKKSDLSLYYGYTNDIERRLKEHNAGLVGYTKKYKPWKLIYYESFSSLEDAGFVLFTGSELFLSLTLTINSLI